MAGVPSLEDRGTSEPGSKGLAVVICSMRVVRLDLAIAPLKTKKSVRHDVADASSAEAIDA
jgi:hypothetical protein